jgi:hypothetical protein
MVCGYINKIIWQSSLLHRKQHMKGLMA